jgi:acetylornithine deacetylase
MREIASISRSGPRSQGSKAQVSVRRVLVVDDEENLRLVLRTLLRKHGYEVEVAASAEEALALMDRYGPDFVLADVRMPGISGIELGNKITKAVADLEAKRVATVTHPLYPNALDTLPCMIGSFSAGNYPSAFPVNCLLKGSIGTVPGEDHEGVKRSLVEQVARAAAEDPWMKEHPPKVRFVGYDAEASEIPRNHPIVETVCKNYREITGRDPEISGRQGAADTRFLNRYADTPTVIFGPGSTAVMHSNDEYVSIEDFITSIKVNALSICDWCGVEARK